MNIDVSIEVLRIIGMPSADCIDLIQYKGLISAHAKRMRSAVMNLDSDSVCNRGALFKVGHSKFKNAYFFALFYLPNCFIFCLH